MPQRTSKPSAEEVKEMDEHTGFLKQDIKSGRSLLLPVEVLFL